MVVWVMAAFGCLLLAAPCAVAGDLSLKGYWAFNAASGSTAADSSGQGNDGTLTNMDTPACWVGGRISNALSFDGVNDYVSVADSSSLDISQTITFEAWVKLDSVSGIQVIAAKGNGAYVNNNWFKRPIAVTQMFDFGHMSVNRNLYTSDRTLRLVEPFPTDVDW